MTDHSYEFLVERQPIGQDLFQQFCGKDPLLSQCTKFLKDLADLELKPDEKYAASAEHVFSQYLAEEVW